MLKIYYLKFQCIKVTETYNSLKRVVMSLFLVIFVIGLLSIFVIVKDRYSIVFIGLLTFCINFAIIEFISDLFVVSTKDGVIGILSLALILVTAIMIVLLPRKDGRSIFYFEQNINPIH